MSETTLRFGLPFIMPSQAQKEVWHNEALAMIDAALHPVIEGAPLATPPADPQDGQCWIVGEGAVGEWSGRQGSLALWTDGGWRYVAPTPGTRVWNKAAELWLHWNGSGWSGGEMHCSAVTINGRQVVGPRLPAILSASGGTIIDGEARAAIDDIIAALMSHGLIE